MPVFWNSRQETKSRPAEQRIRQPEQRVDPAEQRIRQPEQRIRQALHKVCPAEYGIPLRWRGLTECIPQLPAELCRERLWEE